MIVDSLDEAVAMARVPVPVPEPLPEAAHFYAQCTPDGYVLLRWRWQDGRHIAIGVVTPDSLAGTTWSDSRTGPGEVRLARPGDGPGGRRAHVVVDGWNVVVAGSLEDAELVALAARCVLRRGGLEQH